MAQMIRDTRDETQTGVTRQGAAHLGEGDEQGYTLRQAAALLGEPDAALDAALRAGHPDDELQAEGARVASDRIVEDGERLCSQATLLLQSGEEDIQKSRLSAGLTRELRLEIRERLERVANVDRAMEARLAQRSVQPSKASGLAEHLDELALLVEGTLEGSPEAQGLARLRGLSQADAEALRRVAGQLRVAEQEEGSDGRARATERQARLDVLDGHCLLLVGEVLGALKNMARRTRKVRRPTLYRLRGYFEGSKRHEAPRAPAPAPVG